MLLYLTYMQITEPRNKQLKVDILDNLTIVNLSQFQKNVILSNNLELIKCQCARKFVFSNKITYKSGFMANVKRPKRLVLVCITYVHIGIDQAAHILLK